METLENKQRACSVCSESCSFSRCECQGVPECADLWPSAKV